MIISKEMIKDLNEWCCGCSIRQEFLCGQPLFGDDNIVVCDDCYEKIMRCVNGNNSDENWAEY